MSAIVWGIDDVRPENVCEEPLKLLQEFKQSYPHVKVTLFITADWIYKPQRKLLEMDFTGLLNKFISHDLWPEGSYRIDRDRSWVEKLSEFEIAAHGLNHFQNRRPFSAEFERLSYEQCTEKIRSMLEIFGNAGVKPEGFAPPGWGTSENLMRALSQARFSYIAGNVDDTTNVSKNSLSKQAGLKGVNAFSISKLNGIINVPRNWDIHKSAVDRAEEILKIDGVVGVHSHVLDSYLGQKIGNGITQENLKNVEKFLDFVEKNYSGTEFKTFAELSQDALAEGMKDKAVPEG